MIEQAIITFLGNVHIGDTSNEIRQMARNEIITRLKGRMWLDFVPIDAPSGLQLTISRVAVNRFQDLAGEAPLVETFDTLTIWGRGPAVGYEVITTAEYLRQSLTDYCGEMGDVKQISDPGVYTIRDIRVDRDGMANPFRPDDASDDWVPYYATDFIVLHNQQTPNPEPVYDSQITSQE